MASAVMLVTVASFQIFTHYPRVFFLFFVCPSLKRAGECLLIKYDAVISNSGVFLGPLSVSIKCSDGT